MNSKKEELCRGVEPYDFDGVIHQRRVLLVSSLKHFSLSSSRVFMDNIVGLPDRKLFIQFKDTKKRGKKQKREIVESIVKAPQSNKGLRESKSKRRSFRIRGISSTL